LIRAASYSGTLKILVRGDHKNTSILDWKRCQFPVSKKATGFMFSPGTAIMTVLSFNQKFLPGGIKE
jgi:hypothetical protein